MTAAPAGANELGAAAPRHESFINYRLSIEQWK